MHQGRCNVFVGAGTGILKGVQVSENGVQTCNYHNLSALESQHEVCSIAWGDDEQRQVLLGLRSQEVKVYDTEQAAFTMCRQLSSGSGPVIGLGKHQGAVITAVESGVVTLWRFDASHRVAIDALRTGERLCRMRQSPACSNVIATGGQENDLQIWDLNRPDQPTFRAKNVRHDMLDLRLPVWVSDIAFMEDSRRVASCHRHSAVRLYDTASGQRRPVLSMAAGDDGPLTCMSLTHREHQVVVGSGRGHLELCDLRMGRKVHGLKGLAGSVRDVYSHPQLPYTVSVSLDRFLLVHNLETRQLLHKVYLKSQLNCVLMRRDFSLTPEERADEPETANEDISACADPHPEPGPVAGDSDDDIQIVEEYLDDGALQTERLSPDKKKKKKRKLPKLKMSGEGVEPVVSRKQRLPKLVDLSKKKKRKVRDV